MLRRSAERLLGPPPLLGRINQALGVTLTWDVSCQRQAGGRTRP